VTGRIPAHHWPGAEHATAGELAPLSFLDMDTALVERELARSGHRSGPSAENMLRDRGGRS